MTKWAYYNENDDFAAQWLRELIKDGLIADGEVDTRSIRDVAGADTRGFAQVHLFAGIGGWSYALRLAGWSDDTPVWTGSCPCQPFSAAGKQHGFDDERHLWPEMQRLVAECRPPTVFGEQVASRLGREWLAGVRADLEALGYAVGAADLCAAGVAAPHIRQRLYWMADAERDPRDAGRPANEPREGFRAPTAGSRAESGRCGLLGVALGDTNESRPQGCRLDVGEHTDKRAPWAASVAMPCTDGKYRRIPANEAAQPEPSLFPLAYGVSARVGKLRGAGSAIVPQVAAAFIAAAAMSTAI